jgi:hypothetical protein
MFASLLLSVLVAISSSPPVAIASCEIQKPELVQQGDADYVTVGKYAVNVRFTNSTSDQIARVTFALDNGATVVDVGKFSPGISINHSLGIGPTDATSCTLSAVGFADGTTWNQ